MNPITVTLMPAGALLMVVLGYRHYPWSMAMVWGVLMLATAYAFMHWAKLTDTFKRDGAKALLLVCFLLITQVVICTACYYYGYGIAKLFS